ncbi:hypothetical protein IW262DRAFT_1490182 [Armillaria fumosa]|nr:hypothetical protein IW262DRAFT_1490182 [Armillaria fumosa]
MSSIVLPSRGQCIQTTDGIQPCQCLWFLPPQSSLLDPDICGWCEHGIHAHADYVSTVVNNYPANQCAAYAQKTRLTQFCTCGAQFFDHIGTYNPYYIPEPWTVLRYFNADDNVPSPSASTSNYSNDTGPFSSSTASSVYNTAISSGDTRNMSLTPASTSSPSAFSTTSAIQSDATQILGYNSDSHFAHYPTISLTLFILAHQRVARRMRVSNTGITIMQCTLSTLMAGGA